MLFPEARVCIERLSDFWTRMTGGIGKQTNRKTEILISLNKDLLDILKSWQAFRNSPGQGNENFLCEVSEDEEVVRSIFKIVKTTKETGDLSSILRKRKKDIRIVYKCFSEKLLVNNRHAYIVTVSKALLLICGFSIGFDSRVNKRINSAGIGIRVSAGEWDFEKYFQTLKKVAEQQEMWEERNDEKMKDLSPGTPIGKILDRILWR